MGVEFFVNEEDKAAAADFGSGDATDHNVLDDDADIASEFDDILGDAKQFTEVRAKDWQKKSQSEMLKVTLDAFFEPNAKPLNLRVLYRQGLVEKLDAHCEQTSAYAVVVKVHQQDR